mgnify:CR=1 FL=1
MTRHLVNALDSIGMTSEVKLPPLPEADLDWWYGSHSDLHEQQMWDADSMRAYAESHATSIRAQVIEEVANRLDYEEMKTSAAIVRAMKE